MPGRRTLAVFVIAFGIAVSAAAALVAYRGERDRAEEVNAALASQVAITARQSVTTVASGLRGASALATDDGRIKAVRFRNFARDILRLTPFLALTWSPLTTPPERDAFERTTGERITSLGPNGTLVPIRDESGRDSLPVALAYPNRFADRVLGFDLLSDPLRAAVIEGAIDGDETQLSPPMELAPTRDPGVVLYDPVVYVRPGEGRSFAGVLGTGVAGADVAAQVRSQLDLDSDIAISDEGRSLTAPLEAADSIRAEITVLDRRWQVSVPPATSTDIVPAVALGTSGLVLTLGAWGLLWASARRERDLVHRRADAELRAARESLLTRVAEAVESEIGVDARLANLARTLVPAVGDACVVHEATAEGEVRRVGVAATDPGVEALIRSLPAPPPNSPIRAAISSRQPVLSTRLTDDSGLRRARERGIPGAPPAREADPAAHLEADRRSDLIVPLIAGDTVLGTISLKILVSSGRPALTRDDLAFGMEVATLAAVALDNARLYEQQRDIAGILQRALLPRSLPRVERAQVAVRHRPGKQGTEVGGDFYDLFEMGGRWMAVVGDVCGKGPEAAALTALVRHTLRATAQLGPEAAVRRVHEAIRASGEHTYCTLVCAELRAAPEGLIARVTTAGHPEPRVVGADGSVRRLEVTGPLVGVLERPVFTAQEIHLRPGALLFMCSDGIPEARRNGEVFGDARLEGMLAAMRGLEPAALLDRLEEAVVDFVEGRPSDDLALFALRVLEDDEGPGSYAIDMTGRDST